MSADVWGWRAERADPLALAATSEFIRTLDVQLREGNVFELPGRTE